MQRISKALRALGQIIRHPWVLNRVLEEDVVWLKRIDKKFQLREGLPLLDLLTLFPEFDEELHPFGFLDGGSLPTDLALLTALAKSIENCLYFEIGTWRGESVANVARFAKEAYTLNLSREAIQHNGWGAKYADLHGFFSKNINNIHHLEGDSMQFDYAGLNRKFDLIFIDGNHHFEYVKHDTQQVFQHLIHASSIVVWHDYTYTPEHIRPEVFAAILEGVPREKHPYLYHVSNTMSAIFIPKQYPTTHLAPPSTPNKTFSIRIKGHPL